MKFSEIVLFGMPNSGKSTVFNALTKGDAKIGNWHGVTVEIKEGLLKTNPGIKVFDLPGVYSLFPVTLEEKSAIDKVISTNGLIVALIEASTLNIALESVFKLIRKNKRVLIAVNMVKELNKRGGSVDFELLKKSLPVPLIYGDFNTKTEIESLINAINNYNTQTLKIDNYMLNLAEISKFFTPPKYKESFFDKIALHKVFGTVLFLLVFLSSFYLAFGDYGIGKPISRFLSTLFIENLGFITKNFFEKHGVNTFLTAFTVDGIIGGVGGIFVFLPQILVLVGVLTFLELTGYMSRVAYLSDNLLRKTGLNGRAVFSALMGLGCTAVAVSTTNGLENDSVRKKVVLTSGKIGRAHV